MTLISAQWSIDDYHQMIESGLLDCRSLELINGQIIQMSPEGVAHSFYCRATAKYLRSLLEGRAEISEAHPITLLINNSEPEPDIAILRTPIPCIKLVILYRRISFGLSRLPTVP